MKNFLCLLFVSCLHYASLAIAEEKMKSRIIPIPELDHWHAEMYAGAVEMPCFVQGERIGAGQPGRMVFDKYGNAYVACGTFVYVILNDETIHLLAGIPGLPGKADGPAASACFASICSIVCAQDGSLIVGDAGNQCIKRIYIKNEPDVLKGKTPGEIYVETFAGIPGIGGHKDGSRKQALFSRPDGLAFDSKGNLYVLDKDWLRKISGDEVTTLNSDGGTGYADGPLRKAKLNRIMGSNSGMASGPDDTLFIADRWNNIFRKVDLKTETITTIAGGSARGQPGFISGGHVVDGPAMEAHFHSGGGPCTVIRCPQSGRLYTVTADENWTRVIDDKNVWTFGPFSKEKNAPLTGPISKIAGTSVHLLGVDTLGRVYIGGAVSSIILRLSRQPPFVDKPAFVQPNPLQKFLSVPEPHQLILATETKNLDLPSQVSTSVDVTTSPPVIISKNILPALSAKIAVGYDGYLVVWQDGLNRLGSSSALGLCRITADGKVGTIAKKYGSGPREKPSVAFGKKTKVFLVVWHEKVADKHDSDVFAYRISSSLDDKSFIKLLNTQPIILTKTPANEMCPAVASDGENFLVVWSKSVDDTLYGKKYALYVQLLDSNVMPLGEASELAPRGSHPAVVFDGKSYVVAYTTSGNVYVRKVSVTGMPEGEPIKMGGVWASSPAIATDGQLAVVSAGCQPYPNPWGWHGPSAISVGRVTRDGKTPERFSVNYNQLADGGFAGLVDRAQWKGRKGWPAGAPGGFKGTENGYWPHAYSAVTWDGKTWLVTWVRARMQWINLVGHEIFACRVDPETMMPTASPVQVAGGISEPGSHTMPSLASTGNGTSLMIYNTIDDSGRIQLTAKFIWGGKLKGPPRVEPIKAEE